MSQREILLQGLASVFIFVAGLLHVGSASAQRPAQPITGEIRHVDDEDVLVELADTVTVTPGTQGRVVASRTVGGREVQMTVALLSVVRVRETEIGVDRPWIALCRIERQSQPPSVGDGVLFANVQPRPGRVAVRSQPTDATVFLDQDTLGTTPLRTSVDPGTYELRVAAENYRSVRQPIRIRPDREQTVTVALAEVPRATLSIRADPEGTQVFVDGQRLGTTPLERRVTPDTVRIRFERKGFRPVTRTLILSPGERRELSASLQPLLGTLAVRSRPDSATVLLDQDTLGTTPLTETITPGSYEMRVVKAGFETNTQRVRIAPNEQREISVPLRRVPGTLVVNSLPDGATVILGADTLGSTPLTKTVEPDSYQLRIHYDGYISAERSVRVRSSEETRVNASLRRPLQVQMSERQNDAVTSARVTREGDQLVITYDLAGEDDEYTVELLLSTDGGRTFEPLGAAVRGAVGEDVSPGTDKQIVWAALRHTPEGFSGQQNQLRINVEAQGNGLLWVLGSAVVAGASGTIALLLGGGDDGGTDSGGDLPTPPTPPGN